LLEIDLRKIKKIITKITKSKSKVNPTKIRLTGKKNPIKIPIIRKKTSCNGMYFRVFRVLERKVESLNYRLLYKTHHLLRKKLVMFIL
jgi:hypothetical protein